MTHLTLEQEVKNRNQFYKTCISEIDEVLPYVQSMVGQRIYIQSGWSKKWNPPINENKPGNRWVSRWFEVSYGFLYVRIKTCYNNPCEYYEIRFELGKVDENGNLILVNEWEKIIKYCYADLTEQIDYEQEKEKFLKIKQLQKEINNIHASIKVNPDRYWYEL